MSDINQFMGIQITEQLVEELSDQQFSDLFELLRDGFVSDFDEHTKNQKVRSELQTEVANGRTNINSLESIKAAHNE
jgi:hypothetical protein